MHMCPKAQTLNGRLVVSAWLYACLDTHALAIGCLEGTKVFWLTFYDFVRDILEHLDTLSVAGLLRVAKCRAQMLIKVHLCVNTFHHW